MATRFYLSRNTDSPLTPAFDASWEQTSSVFRLGMFAWKRSTPFGTSARTETSTAVLDVCHGQYISQELFGAQTITGTFKAVVRALESNAAADLRAQLLIKVVSRDGGTVRGTLLAHDASALSNEFDAVTLTNRKFPLNWAGAGAALSSVSAQDGDRIVVEIGWRAHNTVATSYTGTLELGDAAAFDLAENETDTLQGNPWFEFSQDLVFYPDETIPRRSSENLARELGVPAAAHKQRGEYAHSGFVDLDHDADEIATVERRQREPLQTQLGIPSPFSAAGEYAHASFVDLDHDADEILTERRPEGMGSIGVEPRDLIQPVIGSWSPLVGSTIEIGDSITFRVTDNLDALARVVVIAEFEPGADEVIHDGDGFVDYYTPGSTRTAIPGGFEFTVNRSIGWAGPGLVIRIFASDLDGNEATPTGYAFTVNSPVLPINYPPIVSDVVPPTGTELTRTEPIFFTVTDDSGAFRRIIVTAAFSDGRVEVVHNGDNFTPLYGSQSERFIVTNGFRYRVRRLGGWPYGPTICAYAIDPEGNENA